MTSSVGGTLNLGIDEGSLSRCPSVAVMCVTFFRRQANGSARKQLAYLQDLSPSCLSARECRHSQYAKVGSRHNRRSRRDRMVGGCRTP